MGFETGSGKEVPDLQVCFTLCLRVAWDSYFCLGMSVAYPGLELVLLLKDKQYFIVFYCVLEVVLYDTFL